MAMRGVYNALESNGSTWKTVVRRGRRGIREEQCNARARRQRQSLAYGRVELYALRTFPAFTIPCSSSLTFTMFRFARSATLPFVRLAGCRGLATATPQLPVQSHGNLPTSLSPITPKLQFFNSVMEEGKQIPTYRVLDGSGTLLDGAELPEVREHSWICGILLIKALFLRNRSTKPWQERCQWVYTPNCSPHLISL